MLFCDICSFTKSSPAETLAAITKAYSWLEKLCRVFNLEIVSIILKVLTGAFS